MSASDLDTSLAFTPRFDSHGLIPVVTIDAKDGAVLMLAYMNAEALAATQASGQATYWSRSRRALWRKGETSGHTQRVVSLKVDCDQDALLLTVEQEGAACHTGERSCFYRTVEGEALKR
jgi:phosphoribosyl-AMP cyclohydrolase